jgi:hypothetical protein
MSGRQKPDVGLFVERQIERAILKVRNVRRGASREDAARWLLSQKEGWYVQAPEGEYLSWVMAGGMNPKISGALAGAADER